MLLQIRNTCALITAAVWIAGCTPDTPASTSAADGAAPVNEQAVASDAAALSAPMPGLSTTLVAYRWQLESATDPSGQSIVAFFPGPENLLGVEFDDGQLGTTGGCNRLSVGYQLLEPAQLQLGPGRSTMMACPPPLADADVAFAKFLTGTLQAEIQGEETDAPVLRLTTVDGTALTFNGQPIPETRFGGPGTRAFLEVSPDPCRPPAPSARPCLLVRDRDFDEQGLPSGTPGEWRALPEGIEGYTPTEGEQHVVRVKRFETPGAAGGEPAVHFVLELIVETRTIQ
jgi:heat shock protein HslJ